MIVFTPADYHLLCELQRELNQVLVMSAQDRRELAAKLRRVLARGEIVETLPADVHYQRGYDDAREWYERNTLPVVTAMD